MEIKKLSTYLQSNQKIALLAVVSSSAMALLVFRFAGTQNLGFLFMVWNLFLAWVPLVFIKWVWEQEKARRTPFILLLIYLVIWLLFFPNAPYVVTDIKHLRGVSENMIWYDTLMLFLFAASGFLTGLYSIRIVHRIISRRRNQLLAWLAIGGSMILSGFGIFLGRYGRWNSWDVLTQPGALVRGIYHSMQDPLAIKHTLAFSFVLMLLYFAFHFFAELKEHEPSHKYS
ncbi:DUF1361 domain-containing protein [Dyadobacter psychrotolerans]|uniref:DUF1361 domain-containing protein n=1 Tax=Dyadobacter psychrotolerans TaxID=2541721 RepID=A0A4R5E2E1_9BACT|nr:DUF1361 domain-containing protein [Dyadobacter psychrotolerans]TDE18495.1 DUF1361 domain-containing protein [Dyadobacter psychrotolerans]